jgi:hypothetical protein
MVLLGFWLGSVVPHIEQRIHYVIAAVILVSLLPALIETLRMRSKSRLSGGSLPD